MFSGIVEQTGTLVTLAQHPDKLDLTIYYSDEPFTDINIGDSIAVNGVCLTVTTLLKQGFTTTAVPETLGLTNLGQLTVGSLVNLERALRADGRIGGHYVQGHVDGMGQIIAIDRVASDIALVTIQAPATLTRYMVNKGYITLDGMSITLISVQATHFTVTFIPHTKAKTVVNNYQIGSRLNIEVDILGKYIEKFLQVTA